MSSAKSDIFLPYYDHVDQIRAFVACNEFINQQEISQLSDLNELCVNNGIVLYEKDFTSLISTPSGVVLEQESTVFLLLNAAVTRDLISFAVSTKKSAITEESVASYIQSRWCTDTLLCSNGESALCDEKQTGSSVANDPSTSSANGTATTQTQSSPSTSNPSSSSVTTSTRCVQSISSILLSLKKFLVSNQLKLKVAPIIVSITKNNDESIIVNSRSDTIGDLLVKVQGKWNVQVKQTLSFDIFLGILYVAMKHNHTTRRTVDEFDLNDTPKTFIFCIPAPLFDEEHGFAFKLKGEKNRLLVHPMQREITNLTLFDFYTSKYKVVVPTFIRV